MKRVKILSRASVLVLASLLTLTACSEESDFPGDHQPILDDGLPESGTGGTSQTTLIWALSDECNDGAGISASFIETINGTRTGDAWPGGNQFYVFNDNQQFNLQCEVGATVCYGAEPSNRNGFYWGVGLSGNEACTDCCRQCGSGRQAISLTC